MQCLLVVSFQFDQSLCINDVIRLMSTRHSITVTLRNCAVILYNLANDDDNCTSMLDAGALMHVVHLTQADLLATKIKCAAILSRLSLHAKHYDQFARHGVLRVLLNLCNVDNILTQRKLVIAISNLSQVRTQGSCLIHLSFLIGYQPPTQQHTAFFMLGGPPGEYFFFSHEKCRVLLCGGLVPD